MTTELEKQFFDTFGIEPKYKDYRVKNGKTYNERNPKNRNIKLCYPQITDKQYLGLLAILNKKSSFIATTIDELKEEALNDSIVYHLSIKEEVRALFKEL